MGSHKRSYQSPKIGYPIATLLVTLLLTTHETRSMGGGEGGRP